MLYILGLSCSTSRMPQSTTIVAIEPKDL